MKSRGVGKRGILGEINGKRGFLGEINGKREELL